MSGISKKSFLKFSFLTVLATALLLAGTYPSFSEDKTAEEAPRPSEEFSTEAAKATGLRAGDILSACKVYFNNQFRNTENIARKATCNGYFFGVGSTLLSLQMGTIDTNICLPSNVTTEQIIQAFLDWGQAEDTDLTVLAPEGTLTALRAKYPCY